MHAYDLDTIEGKEIVVRTAEKGEKFTTLDGQEREMDESVLMICDGKKSIGIAGIMGGENSMITDDVQTNSRRVWIQIMQRQPLTVHAS